MSLELFHYPFAETPYEPALVLGRGLPIDRDGLPCRYYWKEMLTVKPIVDVNGNHHDVTSGYIDQVISDYKKAKSKGHEPYLPLAYHPKPSEPNRPTDKTVLKTENKGFLVDVQRRGDSLYGLHQFIGPEDEIKKTVALQKSSIGILKNVRADDGEVYKTFIDHNAIVPDPQLTGLGNFIAVDAGDSLSLAASRGLPVKQVILEDYKGASMPMQALTADHVNQIKQLVNKKDPKASEGVTDQNAIEMLLGFAEDPPKLGEPILLSREQLDQAQKATGKADLKQEEAPATLLSALTAEKEKNLTLSRDLETAKKEKEKVDALLLQRAPAELNADTAHERSLRVEMGLQQLAGHGYPTGLIDDLKPILMGPADTYDTLMLSRSIEDKKVDIRSMEIVKALLKHREAPPTGTVTVQKEQHMMLQRQNNPSAATQDGNEGISVAEEYNKKYEKAHA